MAKNRQSVEIPLFGNGEKETFLKLLQDDKFNDYGKFGLFIDNVRPEDFNVEIISSAYLLTNALLMTKAKSRIIKMICLNPEADSEIHSVVNALRSMITGDYSSLENVRLWVDVLEKDFELPPTILSEIENTIRFMQTSEIGLSAGSYGSAEVYMGVANIDAKENGGGQFSLQADNLFHYRLSSTATEQVLTFNEIYVGKHNIYRTGDRGLNNFVQISQANMSSCVAEWMLEIDPFLDHEFYKVS